MQKIKVNDSIKKRYFYKIISSVFGFGVSMVSAAIVPRGLGPVNYGNFNFLTNFFTQFIGFFDMGTSVAFYNKISQRQDEYGLVKFYSGFAGIVCAVIFIFSLISLVPGIRRSIWIGQESTYIILAALFAVFSWTSQIINSMTDAYGLTVSAETAKVFQKFIGLLLILSLFKLGKITLFNYFMYQYVVLALLIFMLLKVIKGNNNIFEVAWKIKIDKMKIYLAEFYNYSHPLLAYNAVGLVVGIFDRWLLQLFGGSAEQGYYGLAYNIGAFCFLFTSSMTPLIMREFAISFEKKDIHKMASDFRRYIPFFYTATAYLCCFIAVEADKVSYIFGGQQFKNAYFAVMMMSIYPIHQTYGQLSSAVFLATEKTKLYRNIGVIFLVLGLPITYFLIAPNKQFGLNTGAVGLAVKMVMMQFVIVNVHLWYNSKYLGLPFWRYVAHQIAVLIGFSFFAVFADYIVKKLVSSVIVGFLLSGLLYSIIIAVLTVLFPIIFGVKRQDLYYLWSQLINYFKRPNILGS